MFGTDKLDSEIKFLGNRDGGDLLHSWASGEGRVAAWRRENSSWLYRITTLLGAGPVEVSKYNFLQKSSQDASN